MPPQFVRQPYQVTIFENQQINSQFYDVLATDLDLKGSIIYGVSADFFTGNYLAAFYFNVYQDGAITVRNNLRTESTTQKN